MRHASNAIIISLVARLLFDIQLTSSQGLEDSHLGHRYPHHHESDINGWALKCRSHDTTLKQPQHTTQRISVLDHIQRLEHI
jgi:hypothetical protein